MLCSSLNKTNRYSSLLISTVKDNIMSLLAFLIMYFNNVIAWDLPAASDKINSTSVLQLFPSSNQRSSNYYFVQEGFPGLYCAGV